MTDFKIPKFRTLTRSPSAYKRLPIYQRRSLTEIRAVRGDNSARARWLTRPSISVSDSLSLFPPMGYAHTDTELGRVVRAAIGLVLASKPVPKGVATKKAVKKVASKKVPVSIVAKRGALKAAPGAKVRKAVAKPAAPKVAVDHTSAWDTEHVAEIASITGLTVEPASESFGVPTNKLSDIDSLAAHIANTPQRLEGYPIDVATAKSSLSIRPAGVEITTGQSTHNEVVHPAHYNAHPSGVEAIDILEHFTFNIGNAVKYLWRAGLKHGASTEANNRELRKAREYIDFEIARNEKFGVK